MFDCSSFFLLSFFGCLINRTFDFILAGLSKTTKRSYSSGVLTVMFLLLLDGGHDERAGSVIIIAPPNPYMKLPFFSL